MRTITFEIHPIETIPKDTLVLTDRGFVESTYCEEGEFIVVNEGGDLLYDGYGELQTVSPKWWTPWPLKAVVIEGDI